MHTHTHTHTHTHALANSTLRSMAASPTLYSCCLLHSFCSCNMRLTPNISGWSLREFAKTDPNSVQTFLVANRQELSPLSFRVTLLENLHSFSHFLGGSLMSLTETFAFNIDVGSCQTS